MASFLVHPIPMMSDINEKVRAQTKIAKVNDVVRLVRTNLSIEEGSQPLSNLQDDVRELELRACNISGDGMLKTILSCHRCLHSLEKLTLDRTVLSLNAVKELSANLPNCLFELSLNGCGVTDDAVKVLCKGLLKRCSLKKLLLEQNQLTAYGVFQVASLLKSSGLIELFLSDNKIEDKGLEQITQALMEGSPLETLYLDGNRISFAGIALLSEAFTSGMCRLEILSLDNCNLVSDQGLVSLVAAISTGLSRLVILNLNNCNLTDVSAKSISEAIQMPNWSLCKLRMKNNKFSHDGIMQLTRAMKSSDNLVELSMMENFEINQEQQGLETKDDEC